MINGLSYCFSSPIRGIWHLGLLPIHAYALSIIAGISISLVISEWRWRLNGGTLGSICNIALWVIPFGIFGGRIYHITTDWPTYFKLGGKGVYSVLELWQGGLGIWGAIISSVLGASIVCHFKNITLPVFVDIIAPEVILAQALGRIGNFYNQELYGNSTSLVWGLRIYQRIDFYGQVDRLNGISINEIIQVVHPAFLYEILWDLLVFVFLIWIDKRLYLKNGDTFAYYLFAYCIGRLLVELTRSDPTMIFFGMRFNILSSGLILTASLTFLIFKKR